MNKPAGAAYARMVWEGSDANLTRDYYTRLQTRSNGPAGIVAVNLFRASKTSYRAKRYKGGRDVGEGQYKSYRQLAYESKNWALGQLAKALERHAQTLGFVWGWKEDHKPKDANRWVIYIDLPQGQVSFHNPTRLEGPDYPGKWDGVGASTERILQFCGTVDRGYYRPKPLLALPGPKIVTVSKPSPAVEPCVRQIEFE